MKPLFLTVCVFATSLQVLAQDLSEEVREIGDELRMAQREKQHLQERLELISQRIDLLTQARTLRQTVERFERQLDAAEDNDDGREIERLEEQAEEAELELEFVRTKLEVLQLKLELHWAREEDEQEEVRELEGELKALGADAEAGGGGDARFMRSIDRSDLPAPIRLSETEIAAAGELDFDRQIVPLLKKTCFECHSSESASGDLNLEDLIGAKPLVVNRSHWGNVIQQLRVRSMPTSDADQPSEADRRTLTAWLSGAIDNFDYATVRQPGYEPARRLTHEEYNNTIRDLFGIDLRPADRFPADLTATSGFENSANSLFIQPITMERYIGAAETIVRQVLPKQPKTPAQVEARKRLLAGSAPRDAISRFAARAFRRPLEQDQRNQLLNHFDRLTQSGTGADDALREVLQIILVSPSFLLRSEQDRHAAPGRPFRVSTYELANRLSYFLWASMPDEQLFQRAEDGTLREPRVLSSQVERMLQDDKATTLGSIFASQWLGFSDLDRVPRIQTLIHAIVRSDTFQMKQIQQD